MLPGRVPSGLVLWRYTVQDAAGGRVGKRLQRLLPSLQRAVAIAFTDIIKLAPFQSGKPLKLQLWSANLVRLQGFGTSTRTDSVVRSPANRAARGCRLSDVRMQRYLREYSGKLGIGHGTESTAITFSEATHFPIRPDQISDSVAGFLADEHLQLVPSTKYEHAAPARLNLELMTSNSRIL